MSLLLFSLVGLLFVRVNELRAVSPGGRSGIHPHCPMTSPSLPIGLDMEQQSIISKRKKTVTAAQRPAAVLLHRPFWYSPERPDGQSAPDSGSHLMDHGRLGPSTVSVLLLPWKFVWSRLSHPALLCFTIFSYLYFCNFLFLSLSITNHPMWPTLFQVTRVDWRSLWLGHPLVIPRLAQLSPGSTHFTYNLYQTLCCNVM